MKNSTDFALYSDGASSVFTLFILCWTVEPAVGVTVSLRALVAHVISLTCDVLSFNHTESLLIVRLQPFQGKATSMLLGTCFQYHYHHHHHAWKQQHPIRHHHRHVGISSIFHTTADPTMKSAPRAKARALGHKTKRGGESADADSVCWGMMIHYLV